MVYIERSRGQKDGGGDAELPPVDTSAGESDVKRSHYRQRFLSHFAEGIAEQSDPYLRRGMAEYAFVNCLRYLGIPPDNMPLLWDIDRLLTKDDPDALVNILVGTNASEQNDENEVSPNHQFVCWRHIQQVPDNERRIYERLLNYFTDALYVPISGHEIESREAHVRHLESFLQHYGEFVEDPIYQKWLANPELQEMDFDFYGETVRGPHITMTDLRQRIALHAVLEELTQERKEWLRGYLDEFGEQGLRTLLAATEDVSYFEAVSDVASNLSHEQARVIFVKYLEVVRLAENIRNNLDKALRSRKLQPIELEKVRVRLLQGANKILIKVAQVSAEPEKAQNLADQFGNVESSLLVFASLVNVLAKEGRLEFSEIIETDIEVKSCLELTPKERAEILQIYDQNYAKYPEGRRQALRERFIAFISSPDSKLYLLKHQGKIVSFAGFHKETPDKVFAFSLNVRPEIQSYAIGTHFFGKVVELENENYDIEGRVAEDNPVFDTYINEIGFQKREPLPDYLGSGVTYYTIFKPSAKRGEKQEG